MSKRHQIILNKAVPFMAAMSRQDVRSENDDGQCLYRGPNGTKCFIGNLIKDCHYTPELEEGTAITKRVMEALSKSLRLKLQDKDKPFLNQLQAIHDYSNNELWKHQTEVLCKAFNLEMPKARWHKSATAEAKNRRSQVEYIAAQMGWHAEEDLWMLS